jgi:16S rRNA (guanine527-N7)-methyltransferase
MSRAILDQGLRALGLDLPAEACDRLLAYSALLLKWNRVYNLTAIRDPEQAVTHHLLDSLAVLPYLADVRTLADIGSGGGLPGIPIAVARPDLMVTSIEAVSKKASFQRQARIELGLSNFAVVNERVENVRVHDPYDAVISRAFSELSEFVGLTRHLLGPSGRFFAMKGVYPQAEIDRLGDAVRLSGAHRLSVPGLDAERHLIILTAESN